MKDYVILYESESGNTKEVAEAMEEGLQEYDGQLVDLKEENEIPEAVVYFVGFGVHNGRCSMNVINSLGRIPEGKIALFVTCGCKPTIDVKVKLENKFKVWVEDEDQYAGIFVCQGEVEREIMEKLIRRAEASPEENRMGNLLYQLRTAEGHPDEEDLEKAVSFAKTVVSRYVDGM